MKIKPVGTLEDGYLEIVHNARTQNSSIQYLKKKFQNLSINIKLNRLVLLTQTFLTLLTSLSCNLMRHSANRNMMLM